MNVNTACRKTYRIKSRPRFILFVVIVTILTVGMVNTVLGFYNASSYTIQEYTEITVMSGDTLWDIASTYMSADKDVRHAVYTLCQLNDIQGGEIYAGQTLTVPVYD